MTNSVTQQSVSTTQQASFTSQQPMLHHASLWHAQTNLSSIDNAKDCRWQGTDTAKDCHIADSMKRNEQRM